MIILTVTVNNLTATGNITASETINSPTSNFTNINTKQINGSNWIINNNGINVSSISTNNNKIRIFNMIYNGQDEAIPIVDTSGNKYSSTNWICMIGGFSLENNSSGGPLTNSTSSAITKIINGNWYVRAYFGYLQQPSMINIIAIPIGMVDNNFSSL